MDFASIPESYVDVESGVDVANIELTVEADALPELDEAFHVQLLRVS